MQHPAVRVVLSMVGAVCVTLITSALDTSPTVSLIGAALGAAVPALFNVGGPHGVAAGLGVTAAVLGVTYAGFTAADVAADRPLTFPAPEKVHQQVETAASTTGTTTQQVPVPEVVQQLLKDAETELLDAGFAAANTLVDVSEQPGIVVDQVPGPGELHVPGETVMLSVSGVEVPPVGGKSVEQAREDLEELELAVSIEDVVDDDPANDGIVIRQDPTEGLLLPGQTVVLAVGLPQGPAVEQR